MSGELSVVAFWRRFSLRHARAEWLQTLLLVGLLGLGVGTYLSIRIANRAAVEGFGLFTASLRGDSDWLVEAPGRGIGLDELATLRSLLNPLPVELFPVYESSLILRNGDDEPLRLLGLDLVQLRSALLESGDEAALPTDAAFWQMLDDDHHILLSGDYAAAAGLAVGDRVSGWLDQTELELQLHAVLPAYRGKVPLPPRLAIMDLGALERSHGLKAVSRVEVVVAAARAGAARGVASDVALVAAVGDRLREVLPAVWVVSSGNRQQQDGAEMTAAFRLNLTVLSLIALLVGLYLIAQALDATVSRRRREIATLRSLGLSAGRIRQLWLSEALLYGAAAAAAGLLLGWVLAQFTVEAVTGTIRALYRDTATAAVRLRGADIWVALGLGIGGSLLAAWLPARDAASTPPAQFLRIGKRIPPFAIFRYPAIGYGLLLLGLILAAGCPPLQVAPGRFVPVAGYATAFLWLTGGTLVAASWLRPIGCAMAKLGRNLASAKLAGSRLAQPTSRHQLALAGYLVAVGMASSMMFLISSFEHTVTRWLEVRLQGNLFLSSVGFQGAQNDPRMAAADLDAIEALPEVRLLDRFVTMEARVNGFRTTLGASHLGHLERGQQLLWLVQPDGNWLDPDELSRTAIINESLSRRLGLQVGDSVQLQLPGSVREFRIAGIQADFSRDGGLLLIDLSTLATVLPIESFDTASVFLEDGVSVPAFQRELAGRYPTLRIQANEELMETALSIFRQTFAVTHALQWIGLLVCLAGLALSLVSLLRESGAELAFQRTLGMRRREIATTTALEGLGIGLCGWLGGWLLSLGLGWLLIHVINLQSFGWTLQAAYPTQAMVGFGTGLIALSAVLSFLTGWLYLRRPPSILTV